MTFEESMEDDDYGLIIGKNGELKGLFIPDGEDENYVPEPIVKFCKDYFGVDVNEDGMGATLH
tara:strand:- start:1679 stop:1867 length:189 start_codon:yes stop_codon:yes gene_type:complete